ncbi:hypothetical protein DCS_02042 [Drechmeria coniospora]|uniref:Fungal lipase-type domain-containing protein n=1 Tax=Drechmeria coniospora TaxID=98403 RepID=A0A151GV11_DRECN|nr:hypothetical protein DCS_02042 [Drechmeria coniospora]KYK60903.1 hypothetical protein DCS_02042 [Drechmeria coniospora]
MVALKRTGLSLFVAGSVALTASNPPFMQNNSNPAFIDQLADIVSRYASVKPFTGHGLARFVDGQGNSMRWTVDIECQSTQVGHMPNESPRHPLLFATEGPSAKFCTLVQACPTSELVDISNTTQTCTRITTAEGYCNQECAYEPLCDPKSLTTTLDELEGRLEGASLVPIKFNGKTDVTNPEHRLCSRPDFTKKGGAVNTGELDNFQYYCQHAAATGGIADFDMTDINGYVAIDHTREEIILAIRGSWSVRNWMADALTFQIECPFSSGCRIHAGFWLAWSHIRERVTNIIIESHDKHRNYKVIATGHSLGGAVATIAAVDIYFRKKILVDAYTYGSPRIGNNDFANFASLQPGNIYRITQGNDLITVLPTLRMGYAHTTPEYWISNATASSPTTDDFVKCLGIANSDCSLGSPGVSLKAHSAYFGLIDGCKPAMPDFKR